MEGIIKMEFKRNYGFALFLAEKAQWAIVKQLKHFNVNKMFVDGGPSLEMVRKVKARINELNDKSSQKLAENLHVYNKSMRRIQENELQLKPYKIQKVPDLTTA